jgi:predicted transcriptional regulator
MSTIKKECKVIMLDTKEKSKFGFLTQKGKEVFNQLCWYGGNELPNIIDSINQHIYILSDDEIKNGEWCYDWSVEGRLCKYSKPPKHWSDTSKKIIATTNISLIEESRLMRECYPATIGQISDSFVKKYIESYKNDKPIEKVMVEYETFNSHVIGLQRLKINTKDNTILISEVSEVKGSWTRVKGSYTREEVIKLLYKSNLEYNLTPNNIDNWIEKNL